MKSFYPTITIVITSILASCSGNLGSDHETGQEMNLSNGLTLYAQWSIGN